MKRGRGRGRSNDEDIGGGRGRQGAHLEMGVDAEAAAVVQSHTVLHLTSSGTDVTAPVSRPGTQLTAKIGEREKKARPSRPTMRPMNECVIGMNVVCE